MTSSRRSKTSGDPFANPDSASARWLRAAGFASLSDVEAVGSVEAYRRTSALFPREVSLNLLWGLEAALLGIRWDQLPPELKADLRAQVESSGPSADKSQTD